MAILAECPICRKMQTIKNRKCKCGEDLVKAKKSNRINYYVDYRLHNGRQRRELVGKSIEDARAVDGEKKALKKKKPSALKISADERMTFNELAEWYLEQPDRKAKKYYPTMKINLDTFNHEFGDTIIGHLRPMDLKNYQTKRKAEKKSDSYIDQEIGAARTMIRMAFDNDIISLEPVMVFSKVKKLLKKNANARDKVLTIDEFNLLMSKLPKHTKTILATAFYTGMRKGEVLSLTWDKVDLKKKVISLEAKDTKTDEPRKIPICNTLHKILTKIPRYIHDNHVFLYAHKPIRDIRAGLIRACNDANIKYGRKGSDGFVYHDLRHCFTTYMRKAGVAKSVIMDITGHKTDEMFYRYNKNDNNDALEAVDKFEQKLVELGNVEQMLSKAKKIPSRRKAKNG